jgi:predicted nucleic acid-binding protein
MNVVFDTSILIDILRGDSAALEFVEKLEECELYGSAVTLEEVLVGMRPGEEGPTRRLLSAFTWIPLDDTIADRAGALGRSWLGSHSGIDIADLAIAATVQRIGATFFTRNAKHFPMFPELVSPY